MFNVIDKVWYDIYKDIELASVTSWGRNKWRCTTQNGYYLNIRIKGATLYADLSETENGLGHHAMPIIQYDKRNLREWLLNNKRTSFEEIKKFMNWNCASDQIWDI